VVPQSRDVHAGGLTHHVLEWATPDAVATVLLIHGFMDAAATWDLVASRLATKGLRVLAPDMRGFGDGPRLPAGCYYYFPDYVRDVSDLVDALVPPGSPLVVVGHSMGGNIATLYAGTFPDRPTRLVVVEGAGPPDTDHAHVPDRMRRWIDEVRTVQARGERVMASREDAMRRLVGNHPRVDRDILLTRLDALLRELPDGHVAWKADPLHATHSPTPFFVETFKEFVRRVECPALFVSGGPLGWHPPDEDARLTCFRSLSRMEIADAGHMMHWTRPEELARAILDFLGDPALLA
jgi:pimeloyl-ACP methyl ester carboxylesterase